MRRHLVFLGMMLCSPVTSSYAGLVGHWTLDDGLTDPDAVTVVDSSPNGHDGDLITDVHRITKIQGEV